jgi:hypothetical protein
VIPSKLQVLQTAQFHLGDEQGQLFSYALLEQPFQLAYRELARVLQNLGHPRVQTERFYDLPAYTNVLDPATAGITDFGEVERMEERSVIASVGVTNAVAGSGYVTITTAAAHPFVNGDLAVLWGLGGMVGINGIFAVTVLSPTTFQANGATVIGTYTSGGTASKGQDAFQAMTSRDHIEDLSLINASTLGEYCWWGGAFHFIPNAGVRELRIIYTSSASIVIKLSDTTGIDDSLDYLALRLAAFAAGSRGAPQRAQALNLLALGPNLQADGSGGALRDLIASGVRALQGTPTRRPPFRQRINADITYYA